MILNHLYQSTLFAAAVGLATLALRKNRAQIRCLLWIAASVKFLLPFSILVDVGTHFAQHKTPAMTQSEWSLAVEEVSQPFTAPATVTVTQPAHRSLAGWMPAALYAVWAVGFVTLAFSWWLRWRAIRNLLRTASPLDLPIDMTAMSSTAFVEPGVFGIRRPVLLMPAGITDHLTPPQLEAILRHELCHVSRHDNLATAIHMAVEAVFWYYPVVWWLGARLMEERERACDEEVLQLGSEPRVYAEGILKICELYMETPLACVSGVRGANIKKRIEEIMSNRIVLKLSLSKKAGLIAAGIAVVASPLVVGIVNAPIIRAQSPQVAATVKFETVSIKACDVSEYNPVRPGAKTAPAGRVRWSPGKLEVECRSLGSLVRDAYLWYGDGKPWGPGSKGDDVGRVPPVSDRLHRGPITASPAWVDSDRYDIVATAAGSASEAVMRGPMMQALLEERFKLKIHRESKEIPVYEMKVAEGGIKFQESREGSCFAMSRENIRASVEAMKAGTPPRFCGGFGGGDVNGTTMGGLCRNFSLYSDRDVVDRTGLTGTYDLHFDIHPVPRPAGGPRRSLADVLAEYRDALPKLGLKLEPATGHGVYLVMDHIEKLD